MNDVITGCFWAALAMMPAACVSFIAVAYAASRNLSMTTAAISAGVARLFLAVAASAVIMWFLYKVTLWFVIWLTLFYIITLVIEVYYTIGVMGRKRTQRMAVVGIDGNLG